MFNEKDFVNRCDILLNEEDDISVENFLNDFLKIYTTNDDYDSMITMYGLYLNREIKVRLDEYKKNHKTNELSKRLEMDEGIRLCNEAKKWQENTRAELNKLQNQLIEEVKNCCNSNQKRIPKGMLESIFCVGTALINSATLNAEALDRTWSAVSYMLALAYEEHIAIQRIEDEYVKKYKIANRFINKNKIYLPFYYVAVWDLYKINDRHGLNGSDREYDKPRLKKIIAEIPNFYRNLLSGASFYPEKRRTWTVACEVDDNGEKIPSLLRILDVPFEYYLPSFTKYRSESDKYEDGIGGVFFHPCNMMELPCVKVYSNLTVQIYVDNLYMKARIEEKDEEISIYQHISLKKKEEEELEEEELEEEELEALSQRVEKRKKARKKKRDKDIGKFIEICENEAKLEKGELVKKLEDYYFGSRNYYKVRNGEQRPDKDLLIALSCIFKLSFEQIERLLNIAKYSFAENDKRDVLIKELFKGGERDLRKINDNLRAEVCDIIEGKMVK